MSPQFETNKPTFTVPVGDYVVKIDGVTPGRTKDDSNDMFNLSLTIMGGPKDGKTILDKVFGDSKELWQLIHCFTPLVDPKIGKATFNPDDWKGRIVKIKIAHRMYQGSPYNDIKSYSINDAAPPSEGDAPAAGDRPTQEDEPPF